ncbi:hypothetical protein [Gynuella sunshinyii]|uniref:Uncharacterized protein n=1 Tax=Gynuella sunshinyii YC6258 TaxID=1445510 RepID=A0A0C5VEC2_9GAMM|nr:hypothetical protein [Gynuella sunshinyii]AJQ92882.1 hypothetical Protein YC6258_00832 [Gynuella sunshinyii YC6258]
MFAELFEELHEDSVPEDDIDVDEFFDQYDDYEQQRQHETRTLNQYHVSQNRPRTAP